MSLLVINAEEVGKLLPMARCIDLMEQAMVAASAGEVAAPQRSAMALTDDSATLLLMPGSAPGLGTYGVKLLGLHPQNPASGLPAIRGFVALFDHASGQPLAIIEGSAITAVRTAAASGLATRVLAREDARTCGIFGTGVQAASHIEAMAAVRPLESVLVWGRDTGRAEQFAAEQALRTGLPVAATADPSRAGGCDLVCTVTGSTQPVLQGAWVQPGAHVNLVGSHSLETREADTALISRARLYVDLRQSARNEAGDIMIPVAEGAIAEHAVVGEIGEVLGGQVGGRGDAGQVTVYKSLGIITQDLYAAQYVYERAVSTGIGSVVQF